MLFLTSFLKNKPKTDAKASAKTLLHPYSLGISILLLAVLFSLTPASAQTTVTKVVRGRTTTPSVTPFRQGVIMQNGVLIQVKGDESNPVTQPMTFPNGTTLQPNGIYTTTDGKNFQLKEGDRVDERGVMTRMPVKIEETVIVSGDTTALGAALMKAQKDQEQLQLLQRKRALLEEKSKLLEGATASKTQSAELKKIDADIARVKAELEPSAKKTTTTKAKAKTSSGKKTPAAKKPASPKK